MNNPAMMQQQQTLSQQQLHNLRYQTQAYKHLSANEPVPTQLQNLVLSGGLLNQQQQGAGSETPDSVAQKVVDVTFKAEKQVKTPAAITSAANGKKVTASLDTLRNPSNRSINWGNRWIWIRE